MTWLKLQLKVPARERALLGVLALLVTVWVWQKAGTQSEDYNNSRGDDSQALALELARLRTLGSHASEIAKSLRVRRDLWTRLESSTTRETPTALLLVSASAHLDSLAIDSGVEVRSVTASVDSARGVKLVGVRAALRGETEAIVLLLSALTDTNRVQSRIRSLQLNRIAPNANSVLNWSGTIDFESIVETRDSR